MPATYESYYYCSKCESFVEKQNAIIINNVPFCSECKKKLRTNPKGKTLKKYSSSTISGKPNRHNINKGKMYINEEIKKSFPSLIKQNNQPNESSIIVLIKLLYPLLHEPKTFSELYRKSDICWKRSYLNYVNFAKQLNMINKSDNLYQITETGRIFLNIFRQPNKIEVRQSEPRRLSS